VRPHLPLTISADALLDPEPGGPSDGVSDARFRQMVYDLLSLEAEMREQGPAVQVVIRDAEGDVVDRVGGPTSAGVHRVAWDLEYAPMDRVEPGEDGGFGGGYPVWPGSYTAELVRVEDGVVTELAGPVAVEVVPLREPALPRVAKAVVDAFRREVVAFEHQVTAAEDLLERQIARVEALQTAPARARNPDAALTARLHQTRLELLELLERVVGSEARGEIGARDPYPTPEDRLDVLIHPQSTVHSMIEGADGSYIAFFDLGDDQAADPSPNTPAWVNHMALHMGSVEEVEQAKARLEAHGVDVLGVTDHGFIKSIYFFDPNGYRLELTHMLADEKADYIAEKATLARGELDAWTTEKSQRSEFAAAE